MNASARSAILAEDHFALRLPGDPQISPDARHVAFVRMRADVATDRWVQELCVIDRHTGVQHELGAGTEPRWSPRGEGLAFVQPQGRRHALVRWRPASGACEPLALLDELPAGLSWSPDGQCIAFVMRVPDPPGDAEAAAPPAWERLRTPAWAPPGVYQDRLLRRAEGLPGELPAGHHQLFVLPLGGTPRQLSQGPHDHGGPRSFVTKMALAGHLSWDPDGRHIVMSMPPREPRSGAHDPLAVLEADVHVFDVADGTVERLTRFGGPVCHASVSPDGRWIAFVGFRNHRKSFHTNVVHVMPRGGGVPRALVHPQRLEVHQAICWLPDSSGLLALLPHEGDGCLVRVGLDGSWTTLARDVGGSAATGYGLYFKGCSVADDGTVAYLRGSPSRTDEVALLAPDGAPGEVLTRESAWLDTREVAPVETLWLPTGQPGADAATAPAWQAWLVRPAGAPADRPLPLILWLHGGPYLAWCPHFAILPQVWAARGYAVLMVNPRGSLGYGEAFVDELQHDFPGPGDLQLLDMVDAVVARGGIDPRRVHVAGESGGGVMTCWLIGHSDRFASAAAIYGVVDWASMALTVDRPDYYGYYWLPGPPWEPQLRDHYRQRSPLALVERVRTPTLLLCGECDWRTPIAQSEMYFTALKLLGVDTALVRYPDNNHSLEWHPSHWLDLVEQVDRWFSRH